MLLLLLTTNLHKRFRRPQHSISVSVFISIHSFSPSLYLPSFQFILFLHLCFCLHFISIHSFFHLCFYLYFNSLFSPIFVSVFISLMFFFYPCSCLFYLLIVRAVDCTYIFLYLSNYVFKYRVTSYPAKNKTKNQQQYILCHIFKFNDFKFH